LFEELDLKIGEKKPDICEPVQTECGNSICFCLPTQRITQCKKC